MTTPKCSKWDYHDHIQRAHSGIIVTTPSMLKVVSLRPHPAGSKLDHYDHTQHAQSDITMTTPSMLKVGLP